MKIRVTVTIDLADHSCLVRTGDDEAQRHIDLTDDGCMSLAAAHLTSMVCRRSDLGFEGAMELVTGSAMELASCTIRSEER